MSYSRAEIMAMAPERPVHRIEDWDDDSDSDVSIIEEEEQSMLHTAAQSPIQVSQQAVIIQRPIAVKVVRPIPKHATDEFYSQAFNEGLAADTVHQAVMDSHEWHRKWTMQEEEGHTHPHTNFNATAASTSNGAGARAHAVPDHYAYQAAVAMDRAAGAKNPSPDASVEDKYDALEQRKRIRSLEETDRRSCLSSCSGSDDDEDQQNDNQDRMESVVLEAQPPASRRRIVEPEARVRQSAAASAAPVNTNIVRPVAVRISRPTAVAPVPPSRYTGAIPQHIQGALQRSDSTLSNMSALSLPSVSSNLQTQGAEAVDQVNVVEDDCEVSMQVEEAPVQTVAIVQPNAFSIKDATVTTARDGILQALAIAGGDVTSPKFQSCLQTLESYFNLTGVDTRSSRSRVASEGLWLTLTKPSFYANLGDNDQGDPMYTLGRMSFDMFSPTSLVCSLQGNFNSVERVADTDRPGVLEAVPKGLREEVEAGNSVLRTYNIMTAFTVEPTLAAYPEAPNKDVIRPIKGIMTTYGYTLPDPENPNRHSVWITGGRIGPNNDPVDQQAWKNQFARHPSKHSLGEKAKLLAVKLLMGAELPEGMNEDGSMEYNFTRPIGGHGTAFIDTLYLDDTLRIVRGHRGTIFVFSRMPEK